MIILYTCSLIAEYSSWPAVSRMSRRHVCMNNKSIDVHVLHCTLDVIEDIVSRASLSDIYADGEAGA